MKTTNNDLHLTNNSDYTATINASTSGNFEINVIAWDSATKNKQLATKTVRVEIKNYDLLISPNTTYDINTTTLFECNYYSW